jgi:TPR repeat protein
MWIDSAAGVEIVAVVPRSPADLAGLKADDLILSVDGNTGNVAKLIQYISIRPTGAQVTVAFVRGNNQMSAKVTTADAVTLFRALANQGVPKAAEIMGDRYKAGTGVPQDYQEAISWYQKAADGNDAQAMLSIATLYYFGTGVTQDHEKAFFWTKKAADTGSATGEEFLGILYEIGDGTRQDYKKAMSLYQEAADSSDPEALFRIASLYYKGEGVKKDYEKAFFWEQKAANAGNADGESSLCYDYYAGQGVSQDFTKAFYWAQKAADTGNAPAESNLAVFYQNGFGGPKDIPKAIFWYQRAVDHGYQPAERRLTDLRTAVQQQKDSLSITCSQPENWRSAEDACTQLVALGADSASVRANLSAATKAEFQALPNACADTNDWQAAEEACKKMLDLGIDNPTIHADLAAAARAEAEAAERDKQSRIAELQSDLQAKLDEAEQAERSAADLLAQSNSSSAIANAIGEGTSAVFTIRAQRLRQEAGQDQAALQQLTGQDFQAEVDASEQRTTQYQPKANSINQALSQQLSELNQVDKAIVQRQLRQQLTPQQQQLGQRAQQILQQFDGAQPTGSAAGPAMPDASGTDYSGQYADWVRRLLSRVGTYKCPSSVSAQDGTPPNVQVDSTNGRDLLVKAAVLNAWAAECYAEQEHDNEAQAQALMMMTNLQSAQSLCSNAPIISNGPVAPPATWSIYQCGELPSALVPSGGAPSTASTTGPAPIEPYLGGSTRTQVGHGAILSLDCTNAGGLFSGSETTTGTAQTRYQSDMTVTFTNTSNFQLMLGFVSSVGGGQELNSNIQPGQTYTGLFNSKYGWTAEAAKYNDMGNWTQGQKSSCGLAFTNLLNQLISQNQ